MTRFEAQLPSGSRVVLLDVLLAAWTIAWIVIGVSVADEVEGVSSLSDTVVRVGDAVETSGEALQSLVPLPLVGERLEGPAQRIEEAGRSAVMSGRTSRESIEDLSTLLGVAIALIPSLPLLAFYVPLRISQIRERRALGLALMSAGDDPAFRAFLARRAVEDLPLAQLQRVSESPWADLAEGRHGALADAELARYGLLGRPPRRRAVR